MLKELIVAQQFCYTCLPPPWVNPPPPPPPPAPACPSPSQVRNPSLCRQSLASYVVDGCSVPEQIASALGGDRNDPVNGIVGFTSTRFGVEQGTLPWTEVAQISSLPCNRHDRCYKSCGASQASCDVNFGEDLRGVCARAYPNVVDCPRFLPPFNAPSRCAQYRFESVKCSSLANAMMAAVALAGHAAFVENQERHCDCCNVT